MTKFNVGDRVLITDGFDEYTDMEVTVIDGPAAGLPEPVVRNYTAVKSDVPRSFIIGEDNGFWWPTDGLVKINKPEPKRTVSVSVDVEVDLAGIPTDALLAEVARRVK